jgi:multiple sugar transport system substrate-binding protein
MALDAIQSKSVFVSSEDNYQGGSMQDYYESQPFLMGRVAMTINGSYILNNIKDATNNMKDYKAFKIGLAAGPVDPADPTKSSGYINDLFAIRAGSANIEAAWDFIKFVNGDEFAKVKSKTINNGFSTRQGVSKEFNGISLEAFYKLQPKITLNIDDSISIPNNFYEKYYTILKREVKLLEDNKKTVDEALNVVQSEAQAALEQAFKDKESEKAQKDKK